MYVYFIKSGEEPAAIKIGKSASVRERMTALQISTPYKLELLGQVDCKDDLTAARVEKQAHADLAAFRLSGEWFSASAEVIRYMNELMGKPIKQVKRSRTIIAIEQALATDEQLIKLSIAAERYGLSNHDVKRLRGKIHQNGLEDPIGSLMHDVVYDDRRLKKFVATR